MLAMRSKSNVIAIVAFLLISASWPLAAYGTCPGCMGCQPCWEVKPGDAPVIKLYPLDDGTCETCCDTFEETELCEEDKNPLDSDTWSASDWAEHFGVCIVVTDDDLRANYTVDPDQTPCTGGDCEWVIEVPPGDYKIGGSAYGAWRFGQGGAPDLTKEGTYELIAFTKDDQITKAPCTCPGKEQDVSAADDEVTKTFTIAVTAPECGTTCECGEGLYCCANTNCYDPETQCCNEEDGSLYGKCGEICCQPEECRMCDGTDCISICEEGYECCEGICYNPDLQCCDDNDHLKDNCGMECCEDGQTCCDGTCCDADETCCNSQCCGGETPCCNPETGQCEKQCSETEGCCGGETPCCDGYTHTCSGLCGDQCCDVKTCQHCVDDGCVSYCGDQECCEGACYNPDTQCCEGGSVKDKCGDTCCVDGEICVNDECDNCSNHPYACECNPDCCGDPYSCACNPSCCSNPHSCECNPACCTNPDGPCCQNPQSCDCNPACCSNPNSSCCRDPQSCECNPPDCDDNNPCTMDKCVTTYDGEGKFSKTCAHAKLEVTRIRLPFGHVAIPDLPVYQESYQESMQLATTDVEITCACTADPGIEVCEGASIQLRFSGQILDSSGTWRTVENEVLWNGALPAGIPAGQSRTEIESVAIDRQGLGSGSYRFVVEKREQKPDEPEERVAICYTKISDARSLFYDIEFVPSAHFRNAQGYVRNQSDGRYTYALCPYTWVHPSLVDSDNNELLWYGLSLEFSLRANLDSGGLPNSKGLYITVTGDGISKEIKWSDDVIRAGARRPVKWEGYDDYVHEDEVENVTSFPQGRFSTQYAPQHVVSEGEYYYNIEGLATDTDHDFTQNDLMQKHAVTVKIIVEYELSRILH